MARRGLRKGTLPQCQRAPGTRAASGWMVRSLAGEITKKAKRRRLQGALPQCQRAAGTRAASSRTVPSRVGVATSTPRPLPRQEDSFRFRRVTAMLVGSARTARSSAGAYLWKAPSPTGLLSHLVPRRKIAANIPRIPGKAPSVSASSEPSARVGQANVLNDRPRFGDSCSRQSCPSASPPPG